MNPVELTALVGSAVASLGGITGVVSLMKYRQGTRATAAAAAAAEQSRAIEDSSDATVNLQKGQEAFIRTLTRENENWRKQVDELHRLVDQLRREIEELRADLATERRAREAAEARATAEQATRTRLGISSSADEREISASGDAAVQASHEHFDEPGPR